MWKMKKLSKFRVKVSMVIVDTLCNCGLFITVLHNSRDRRKIF